jgi:hypothetical protein
LKTQLRYNSEARTYALHESRAVPHFASPHGYPPIEEPTPTEVGRRKRQQASMVRTTLDFQVSEKRRAGDEMRRGDRDRFMKQVENGLAEREAEEKKDKEKRDKYKQEIVTVWDRTNKLAEVKRRLEHDLGIAINDDKIKFLMKQQ